MDSIEKQTIKHDNTEKQDNKEEESQKLCQLC